MTIIDIENSGFTLCVKKPQLHPYKDEGGIWKAGESAREHLGFEPLRRLYAPEGSQVDSNELPFITYK
jgi:hypothetical protein